MMETKVAGREMLRRLGAGEPIDALCAGAGISRAEFDAWWKAECAARVPEAQGARRGPVNARVEILRDTWGIPHILAEHDEDLFFGFGYAMAQDRLWQMDYLRRKALGRLAEILGAEALEGDRLMRTVGLNRLVAYEVAHLPSETQRLLDAFTRGVNALMADSRERWPIEFALLDYEPEPWTPGDCIAVWADFRWYATVRFPVIVLPELAKRTLGSGALFRAFLTPEAGDESIIPRGTYPARKAGERAGDVVGDPEDGAGSNNWLVDGKHSATGLPLVASDPHIAFGSVGCWYESHLCGGSFNVAGTGFAGLPTIVFGRSERVAWGITNNICSQRDLYQERTDAEHPDCFLYDGAWEPARTLVETIHVRGGEAVHERVRFSRNGPLVDEFLPAVARHTGPVSLRWLGATFGDEATCMLAMNRARSCAEFREALREWRVPTWSFIFADVDGHSGYQCAGRIPVRSNWERGYRPGWDPAHQWHELVPFEGMPALADPSQGWIRSANNRTAPEDYPYPLSGTWSSGHRAQRIRQMLDAQDRFAVEDFARMHQDVLSLRAVEGVPGLLDALAVSGDDRVRRALAYLRAWDCNMLPESVGASLFDTFFRFWSEAVARERFAAELAPVMAGAIGGLALALLSGDKDRWFERGDRCAAIQRAFEQALDDHERRLGPDMSQWSWGRSHTIALRHTLAGRGDLGELLSRGGQPVRGNGLTVCNTGYDPNYMAVMGANYRLIADLSTRPASLRAVDAAGESGHPGSAHYCDQLPEWLAGRYHTIPLDRKEAERGASSKLIFEGRER